MRRSNEVRQSRNEKTCQTRRLKDLTSGKLIAGTYFIKQAIELLYLRIT